MKKTSQTNFHYAVRGDSYGNTENTKLKGNLAFYTLN